MLHGCPKGLVGSGGGVACAPGEPGLGRGAGWHRCASPHDATSTLPQVIYVARNPKDIVVSFYHFHKMAKFLPEPSSFEDFLMQFLDGTGERAPSQSCTDPPPAGITAQAPGSGSPALPTPRTGLGGSSDTESWGAPGTPRLAGDTGVLQTRRYPPLLGMWGLASLTPTSPQCNMAPGLTTWRAGSASAGSWTSSTSPTRTCTG